MGLKFGTSGIRGLAAEMTVDSLTSFLDAFLAMLLETGNLKGREIAVGCDLRESSPRIADIVKNWLHARGGEMVNLGVVPTPALAYYCSMYAMPGIMITGSHIPADRNGIQFYLPDREILKEEEARIMALREARTQARLPTPDGGNASNDRHASGPGANELFLERYQQAFPAGFLKGRRFVVYQHSSAARDVLTAAIEMFGGEAIAAERSNEFVAVDTENLKSLGALAALVKEHAADGLVSTDGDGDRPLMLDERGELMRGDLLGCIGANVLAAERVVTPVTSSTAVELSGRFGEVVRTRVGSPYVIMGMQGQEENKRTVGYEANGGFILGSRAIVEPGRASLEPLLTRDSILPVLLVLLASAKARSPLSELRAAWPGRYNEAGLLAPVDPSASEEILRVLASARMPNAQGEFARCAFVEPMAKAGFEVGAIDAVDGQRWVGTNQEVVHFRPSGNAPEFRVYTESHDPNRAKALLEAAMASVRVGVERLQECER